MAAFSFHSVSSSSWQCCQKSQDECFSQTFPLEGERSPRGELPPFLTLRSLHSKGCRGRLLPPPPSAERRKFSGPAALSPES